MKTQQQINTVLERYLSVFPDEQGTVMPLYEFVGRWQGEMLYDRKNFDGHITASGFVLDPRSGKLLLLDHLQLKKWLQPGGHVDPQDSSVLAAILREIEEETGIEPMRLRIMHLNGSQTTEAGLFHIFDIDTHYIAPSKTKNEAGHFHHDIRYLFRLTHPAEQLKIDYGESGGYKWVKPEELPLHFGFGRVASKLKLFSL